MNWSAVWRRGDTSGCYLLHWGWCSERSSVKVVSLLSYRTDTGHSGGTHWAPLTPTVSHSHTLNPHLIISCKDQSSGWTGGWLRLCLMCRKRRWETQRQLVEVTWSRAGHTKRSDTQPSDSQVTLGTAVKRVTGHFLLVPSVWPVGPLRPQSNKIVVGNTSNLQTCSHWLLLGVRIIEGNSSDLINNSCYLFISFRMIKYRGDGGLAQRMSWLKMWRGRRERRGRTVRLLIVCSTLLTLVISTQGIRCYTDLEATQVSTGNRN